jgi:scyllo-inositol 2-dehydrogenase (NADP+)
MSTSTSIRTAVIGYGLAGKVFHCPFVHAVPGLELAAIVVASPGRAEAAHVAYPDAKIIAKVEEVLKDPAIELIVVATPNDTHADLAAQALKAGKHVVVDKPMTTSSEEALKLIELGKAQGKILAPFHNRRYDNDFLTVSKLHREGTLGRITEVISHFDRFRPLVRPNTWKESGPYNGLLFDLGPHLVDQAVALFGVPETVKAVVRDDRDVTDIEDFVSIVLEYPRTLADGSSRSLRYTCQATMLAAEPAPRFRVHGTLGSYVKQGLDPQEAGLLHKGLRPPVLGSQEAWLPEPESAWGTLTVATKLTEPVEYSRGPYPSLTGDYRLFYANVRDAISGASALAIPPEDAYRVIRLLELARESSEEKRTLAVTIH